MARRKSRKPPPAPDLPPAGPGRTGDDHRTRPASSRTARAAGFAVGLLLLVAAALAGWWWSDGHRAAGGTDDRAGAATPDFVGSATCAGCHAEQFDAWSTSQHALAMQPATAATVLGDFSDVAFSDAGSTTTFFRRDSLFLVRTVGPGGTVEEFEVAYTFGVDPLQQYLIELEGGHIQALTVAWDSRPAADGGQRWMSLYPGESLEAGDELHWTGRQQNWNFMCADCHSTRLEKNYERESDSFATRWSEVHVGCEGCHGPASRHVAWAGSAQGDGDASERREPAYGLTADLNEREGVTWTIGPDGLPTRNVPRQSTREIAVCAQCHSRRAQIAEGYVAGAPLLDHYLPSLLTPGLYHPDGQQRDEVYIHASFLQSRMFAAGVTCSDCHEPHSGGLRFEGNALCTQCHVAARYDAPIHHFHEEGTDGAACVSCHMPATTYMRIDPRRDHSLRVPRPDRTVTLGVPNACNQCHVERDAAWAATVIRDRYGHEPQGYQGFAEAFAAHEGDEPGADTALVRIARDAGQPAIVRASALARLAERPTVVGLEAARVGLSDPDPLARRAALELVAMLPGRDRLGLATPLLSDSTRGVRMQAAWALAPVAATLPPGAIRDAFDEASAEFIASQRYLADRPESRVALGTYLAQLGRAGEAAAEYRAAVRMRPEGVEAYVNLADLYRSQGLEGEAERVLREGLVRVPTDATLHHALGLSLARSGRMEEARQALRQAAELGRDSPRYAYAYAVALHSSGEVDAALEVVTGALERHPRDYDLLFALATFQRDAGRVAEAREATARLRAAHPGDPVAAQLEASLR